MASGHVVDDVAGEVGVAGHPAEPGIVLGARRDSGIGHPGDERGHVAGDGHRIVPVLAIELADRGVLGVRSGRHDIGDRGEVQVDAGVDELATPAGRLALERSRRHGALVERRRDRVEAGPRQALDQPTFLVRRDEEPDPPGRRPRRERLDGVGERPARPATPAALCFVNATEPKWDPAIAASRVESSWSFLSPTMNSCPIRWASVNAANVRSAHDAAALGLGVGGGPDGRGVAASAVDGDVTMTAKTRRPWPSGRRSAGSSASIRPRCRRPRSPRSSASSGHCHRRLAEDASGRAGRRQALLRSRRWSRSLAASSIALWRHSAARNWQAMRPIRWTRRKSP